jgi:hypothetical protein
LKLLSKILWTSTLTIILSAGSAFCAGDTPTIGTWKGKISSTRLRSTAKVVIKEVNTDSLQCQITLGRIPGVGVPEKTWDAKATLKKKDKWLTKTPEGNPVTLVFKNGQILIKIRIKGPEIRFSGTLSKI